jgi:hypothetical protein
MTYRHKYPDSAIERVDWKELEPEFIRSWGYTDGKFGAEHVSIVGPTGSGKSNFQSYVLRKRCELRGSNAIVIATKPADSTLRKMHWPIIRKYPPEYGKHERFILWPETSRDPVASLQNAHFEIQKCLTDIWHENSNTIVAFDEIAFVEQELKLKTLINRYWREARSLGITVVATTQRPRNVTRYMWSEPTWIVAFGPDDEDEARRVAEIVGGRNQFTEALMSLKNYEFIIRKRRSKEAYISK